MNFDDMRTKIKNDIPIHIQTLWAEYERFMSATAPAEAKEFGAFQCACKNAIAHIGMLIKLGDFVAQNENQNVAQNWLKEAREALEKGEMDESEFN